MFCRALQLHLIVSYSQLAPLQDLAEHLVIHGHCLNSTDHNELSSLFNLGQQSSHWAMDHRVALAMANLDIPPNWNVLGSHSGDGESCTVLSCRTGIPTQLCLSKTHKMQFLFHEKMYLKIQKNLKFLKWYTLFIQTKL